MARHIPEESIAEVKHSSDIVEVVSDFVRLKKAGRNFLGLCPFHSEKTPSFTVSPEKQIFHCFGCGESGSVFNFLMKQEGLSFPEAVRHLAKRCGIRMPSVEMSDEERAAVNQRERLHAANLTAVSFFEKCLADSRLGAGARAYLARRGIAAETIDAFRLGFAPDRWDGLLTFFRRKKVAAETLLSAGLIIQRNDGNGYYDRFRGRIVFPIFDIGNQVVGFGGRVFGDGSPKYMNSPETPIYNKSRSLYGLHSAKRMAREKRTVFIVEGYFDLLSLYQGGIENTVATLGTALTAAHVRRLKGFAEGMILVYDSDEAGLNAAKRSIDLFITENVDARIMVLPVGHDPDSYVRANGSEKFLQAADRATGVMSFLMESAISKHGLTVEGKLRILSELSDTLTGITDNVTRSVYVKELSERIGIESSAIFEKIGSPSHSNTTRRLSLDGLKRDQRPEQGRTFRFERQIVSMMLQYPEILEEVRGRNILFYFQNELLKSMGVFILDHENEIGADASDLMERFTNGEQRRLIADLLMKNEAWTREGCLRLITQFEIRSKKDNRWLNEQIKAAENAGDQELLVQLLKKKQTLAAGMQKYN